MGIKYRDKISIFSLNQRYFDFGKKNKEVFVFVLCRETTFRLVGMKVGGAPLLIGCDMTCLAAPIRSQPNATSDAKKIRKKKKQSW